MSLRRRLLLILGGTFIALWSLSALWLQGDLRREISSALDDRLESSAQMVAGLVSQLPPTLFNNQSFPFPSENLGMPIGLACQVRSVRGEVIVQTSRSPNDALNTNQLLGFHEVSLPDGRWRTFSVQQGSLIITTADEMTERETLENAIVFAGAFPVLLALIGSLVLIWLGIGQGLYPLRRLGKMLTNRKADDMSEVKVRSVPAELRPFVVSLNHLLTRIGVVLDRERRFTDDAAHELRTPLTAIKTHLQIAQMTEGETANTALAKAEQGVERMQRMIEQLLLLARVENRQDYLAEIENSTPEQIVRQTMAALIGSQGYTRISIDNQIEQPINLQIPETLAVIALRNLLENALRYSQTDTQVLLSLQQQENCVVFSVSDIGKGIDDSTIEQMQQRFWRNSQEQQGCGLGLAIVRAICEHHDAQLYLEKNQQQGLTAQLIFKVG